MSANKGKGWGGRAGAKLREGGRGGGRLGGGGGVIQKSGGGGGHLFAPEPPFGTGFKLHFRYQVSVFKLGVPGVLERNPPPPQNMRQHIGTPIGIQIHEPIAGMQSVISLRYLWGCDRQ